MKIVVDGRFWGPGHTGLGVYTQNLVENLLKIDKKNQYTVLRPDIRAYTLWEQIAMPVFLAREKPDLVHFPSINVPIFYFGKYVVTVHDLIKHESRGTATSTHHPLVYWPKYFLYLFVVWWAVKRAAKILVPSNDVKNRLLAAYKLPADKVVITYEAAVLSPRTKPEPIKLPDKFALYVGNAYPHKNLPRLISAWKEVFQKTKVRLVIISGRGIFADRIKSLVTASDASSYVSFAGYVSLGQQVTAYKAAQAYVFPSLAEGFGLPGLDAMVFDVPVVCSNIPVLREVYGDAAVYFDPDSIRDIANKIVLVLTDAKLRADLVHRGKIQVAKYSWAETASQTLSVYESCFSLRSG